MFTPWAKVLCLLEVLVRSKNKVFLLVSLLLLPQMLMAQNDPTAPIGFSAPLSKIKSKASMPRVPGLQAILCSEKQQCTAILNGQEFNQGQSINGYVISSISEHNVIVTRGDRRWSLQLFP